MKDLSWIKEGYFAHRGLHNKKYPENTMLAFQNAVNNQFDIELDIQITKDNQIIVFHDDNTKRLCKVSYNVVEETYDTLKECKILDSNQTIPLLRDVLGLLPKETKYLIELKPSKRSKEFVSFFLELMNEFDVTYAIHSFDPRIVNQFKKQQDQVIRGQIASAFPDDLDFMHMFVKNLWTNIVTKPDFVNYRFEDLPRKKLDKLREKGTVILSYTARNQKGLDFVKSRYDNAVFENFIPKR